MRIALADIARAQADGLRRLLPGDDIVDIAAMTQAIDRLDVLIASRFGTAEGARHRFRLLQVPGAGLDKVELAAVPSEATVCNAYEHEGPIAEYVLSAMLDATVGLSALAREMPDKVGGAPISRGSRMASSPARPSGWSGSGISAPPSPAAPRPSTCV